MNKIEYPDARSVQQNNEYIQKEEMKTIGLIYNNNIGEKIIREITVALKQKAYQVLSVKVESHPEEAILQLSAKVDSFFFCIPDPDHYLDNLLLPLLCERQNSSYAGSDPLTQALAMHKHISKILAVQMGVATPAWHYIQDDTDLKQLPVDGKKKIVKPVFGTFSKGISIASDYQEICTAIANIREEHKQAAIVEDFISGYEVTVPVLSNGIPKALAPVSALMNQNFLLKDKISTTSIKKGIVKQRTWQINSSIPPATVRLLKEWSEMMHKAVGCRGFSRVDFRISEEGQAYFLEINALPGMSKRSSFSLAAQQAGLGYEGLLHHIVEAV